MASHKSSLETHDITSIRSIEGIFLEHNPETRLEETGDKKGQHTQNPDREKAFEMQDKGFKNALNLF
jgi:hypothetical protein